LNAQQLSFNRASVGRVMSALLDRPGRAQGQLMGRTPYMQAVHVEYAPRAALGAIVELRIAAAYANSLAGVPVDAAARRPGQGAPLDQQAPA